MFHPGSRCTSPFRLYLDAHDTEIDQFSHVREGLAIARGARTAESFPRQSPRAQVLQYYKIKRTRLSMIINIPGIRAIMVYVSPRSRNRRPEKAPGRKSLCPSHIQDHVDTVFRHI